MKIAFYISNHGFGHIMRNLPVMACLLKETEHSIMVVTAAKQMQLAEKYLMKESGLTEQDLNHRVTKIEQDTDLGLIVKSGTLQIDKIATREAVGTYTANFPIRIKEAVDLFKANRIDRVVCDIVPWALTAAKLAEIPSYLMASFTWIEQYEDFMPESDIVPYQKCFADADQVLFYDLVNEPTRKRFPNGIDVGLCARPFHSDKVCEIKEKYGEKPIVFLSVGGSNSGIAGDIDVSKLPYQFITTGGLGLKGKNVEFLPVEIENTQDYIAASDYCISKAGWSTLAEMMLAGKSMALLGRPDVPEDCMNISKLVDRGEAVEIQVKELEDMENVIAKIREIEFSEEKYHNNISGIMNIIIKK